MGFMPSLLLDHEQMEVASGSLNITLHRDGNGTWPQVFVSGKRIGGANELGAYQRFITCDDPQTAPASISPPPPLRVLLTRVPTR